MKNKIAWGIVAVLVLILILVFLPYLSQSEPANEATLSVYADGTPIDVDVFVDELENHPYFTGCNNTTIEWLKSQNGKVFSSEDAYVLMSSYDAGKLPLELATDVLVNDTFTCEIKEKRPLGKGLDDVLLVDHVQFQSQNIEPAWV